MSDAPDGAVPYINKFTHSVNIEALKTQLARQTAEYRSRVMDDLEIDGHQVPDNELGFDGIDWCADTGVMNIYVDENGKYPSVVYVVLDGIERRYSFTPQQSEG